MPRKANIAIYVAFALSVFNLVGLVYLFSIYQPSKDPRIGSEMSAIVRLIRVDLVANSLRKEMNDAKAGDQQYLPPTEVHGTDLMFNKDRGGVSSDGNTIRIYIALDLPYRLDENKMRAYLAHELAHIALDHRKQMNIYLDVHEHKRYAIEQEKEADSLASNFVDRRVLAEVIRDLAKDDEEEMMARLDNLAN